MSKDVETPAQFYTGLVAELYEPLLGEVARADDYAPFLDLCGTPALELACGSGLPLLELVERGYDLDGLDASQDMLDRCRSRAAERGLNPNLYLGEMQSFELPRRYRSIFLAGASFTLLTTDADAAQALERIHVHLEPGGHVLIPLEVEDPALIVRGLGKVRETVAPNGDRLRVCMTEFEPSADGRNLSHRLRYERIPAAGEPVVTERNWERRSWTQGQFRELVTSAGFAAPSFLAPTGGPAEPDAAVFVTLARKPLQPADEA